MSDHDEPAYDRLFGTCVVCKTPETRALLYGVCKECADKVVLEPVPPLEPATPRTAPCLPCLRCGGATTRLGIYGLDRCGCGATQTVFEHGGKWVALEQEESDNERRWGE